MRIDSSGNLLVGKASANSNSAGIELHSNDIIKVTRSGGATGYFNRNTNDGNILELAKDGTSVGSIGTSFGDITIGGKSGLRFDTDSSQYVIPYNVTDNAHTTTVDLGTTDRRFKDAYLSGGVYLGGTVAANKLEDYEEGTFTPAVENGWGVLNPTYNTRSGYYTKVGNKVYIVFHIILSGGSLNGNKLQLNGFPFSVANTSYAESTLNGFFYTASSQQATPMFVMASNGTTGSFVRRTTTNRTNFTGNDAGNGFNLSFSGTYLTDQ
jgi:hypothetical protein